MAFVPTATQYDSILLTLRSVAAVSFASLANNETASMLSHQQNRCYTPQLVIFEIVTPLISDFLAKLFTSKTTCTC